MNSRPLIVAVLLSSALAGCGKQTLIAGIFFQTPKVSYTDPAHPEVQIPLGPYNLLTGFAGSIDTSDPTKLQDAKVVGISGAKAAVVFHSCRDAADKAACLATDTGGLDRVLSLKDQTNGIYTLTNLDEPNLTFEAGVHYTLVLEVPSEDGKDAEAFGARFVPAPAPVVTELKDKTATKHQALGQGMTLTREEALVNGERLPAFVVVAKVDPNNPQSVPEITWTSLDYKNPKVLVQLALSDQPYRKTSYAVDGSAFASPGTYVVALLTIAEGKASANAFIGSTALAGSGDAGLVQVP